MPPHRRALSWGSAALLVAGDIKHKGIVVVLAAIGFAAACFVGVSEWFVMALVAVILLALPIQ